MQVRNVEYSAKLSHTLFLFRFNNSFCFSVGPLGLGDKASRSFGAKLVAYLHIDFAM